MSTGKRLKDLPAALSAFGNRTVQLRLYPQTRHSLLNEINRDEVSTDILGWLEQALALGRAARNE
ncbi:alpha-beta hydrolase superfamily lysophospholipase [Pseudomonas hunanensis]|uniref:Alpha-beta hydrolase superfamily lysophospholipase n=1 Tax=Pseudomonas hunanensis TaxID=1247546 RepID=A0ACC6K3W3_9PSED|nr:alpha-beta hydrolase superfamily lysophospholipase [Pseudomonas sp. BP8]MDR6713112.1 alpha-beta hydrolase superfamily lysophospholipase [Pseudomonas hunanensis]